MQPPPDDDDATVRMPPPVIRRRRRAIWPWAVAAAIMLAVAAGGLWPMWRSPPPPIAVATAPTPPPMAVLTPGPEPPSPVPAPVVAPPPAPLPTAPPVVAAPAPPPVTEPTPIPPRPLTVPLADEAAIAAHSADRLTVFRFAPAPAIVVLDFPSLQDQGEMLDRVAAFVEKAGLPRDRVLTDAELAAAIRAHNDTVATYYYGHDYPAAQLQRFFALADRDHIALSAPEQHLRTLLEGLGVLAPGSHDGLVSLSRAGADADVTPAARATILHHELSHGVFFTDPAYAAFVRGFWQTALTEAERAAIRRYLGAADYDPADEELMLNEMQAYLMFTTDPHFFRPGEIGMVPSRREQLAADFARRAPPGWPHDALAAATAAAPALVAPARATSAACRPGPGCR